MIIDVLKNLDYNIEGNDSWTMDKLIDIFSWIDKEMKFDTWYKLESQEQKSKITRIMDAELISDCEFNAGYTEFKKSKIAFETFVKNK